MSARRPPADPTVRRDDLYLLLVSTVRYALGRKTYIVSATCDMVRAYARYLWPSELDVLIRDIEEHNDYYERRGTLRARTEAAGEGVAAS